MEALTNVVVTTIAKPVNTTVTKERSVAVIAHPEQFHHPMNVRNVFSSDISAFVGVVKSCDKSLKADAINGTRNGFIQPLLWLRQSRNLILACTGYGYTRSLSSLRETRNLDSACPA
ncbi:MAG TPA: hypothetical protein VJ984_05455 [Xanthomonadales bacterium]|nr:hypothetical protein [Xanthomonadales bacterium]